ncbi:MAG: hypothetical protein H8E13_13460 [Actinobacteria bacterium]|nr:hypothetical protein [Actinomycetota bacterium]
MNQNPGSVYGNWVVPATFAVSKLNLVNINLLSLNLIIKQKGYCEDE